jgi:antitoxin CcdA
MSLSTTAQMIMLAQTVAGLQSEQDVRGRKRAVNVTIDEAVLAEAKKLGINLSNSLEGTLREIIKQTRIREWESKNHEAVASYNQLVGAVPEVTA